jgi:hypothetical protein
MKPLLFSLLLLASFVAGQAKQKFTGTITDSMCATADHSSMKMGPTDADCTIACVRSHGAEFVLWDGKSAYNLSDQKSPEKFAGKKATVMGTLNAKTMTIQVDSIAAAK